MKYKCILLFHVITRCCAISEDYFFNNDEVKFSNKTNFNSDQKILNNNATTHSNKTMLEKCDDFDTIEECENNNEVAVGKRVNPRDYTVNLQDISTTNTSNSKLLDSFKNYLYRYDENANVSLRSGTKILATKIPNRPEMFNSVMNVSKTLESLLNDKFLIDFYNIKPAGSVLKINDADNSYFKYEDNNVWYVPESLPCWKLPILYGTYGERNADEVFHTSNRKLRFVTEKIETFQESTTPKNMGMSQIANKWCSSSPCYGDHTLCLFSRFENSNLCLPDYEVSTPQMVGRIGIVNTLNAMRNRVANGVVEMYNHLPKAADMNQIIYDFDLQSMSAAWLRQCLPGPSQCSSLDNRYVSQLECTKHADHCCLKTASDTKCVPNNECFVDAIVGCIHKWFRSAKTDLTATDVECGHITSKTFYTVQLLWAETNKIGCAYGMTPWGNVRTVCSFSPGAPFYITTKYFCGFLSYFNKHELIGNFTSPEFLQKAGIKLNDMIDYNVTRSDIDPRHNFNYSIRKSEVQILHHIYNRKWIRTLLTDYENGSLAFLTRLVTKYRFGEDTGPQCDKMKQIYVPGIPGSLCEEKGRRFQALCYDFRDPTPGYRLVAVLAPIVLFSIILYDLFNGVVRQNNC